MAAIPFYKSVCGTHFLAGDSWRSRSKHYRAMAGATVNYRLNTDSKVSKSCSVHQGLQNKLQKSSLSHILQWSNPIWVTMRVLLILSYNSPRTSFPNMLTYSLLNTISTNLV